MKRDREEATPTVDFLTEAITKKISQYNDIEHAEVEARLCLMTSKTSRNERLRVPIESPAILATPHNITVGVDRNSFEKLLAVFRAGGYASTTVSDETAAFNDGERVEKDSAGKIVAYLKKRKLSTIDILIPGSPYDLRIGVATETPLDMTNVPVVPSDAYVRRRNRTTFQISDELSADFTVIEGNGKPVYEVEVEMTFPKLQADHIWVGRLVSAMKNLIDILKQRPAPKPPVPAVVAAVPVVATAAPGLPADVVPQPTN